MTVHSEMVACVQGLVSPIVVYDGQVPRLPPVAYVLIDQINTRPVSRALSRDRHGSDNRWRLTVVSNSPEGVRAMCARLDPLDGARVLGQRVEEVDTGMGVEEDDRVITDGVPRWYTKREYRVSQPT